MNIAAQIVIDLVMITEFLMFLNDAATFMRFASTALDLTRFTDGNISKIACSRNNCHLI